MGTDAEAALDRALDLAQRYAPDRVSNLMTVGGTQQVMLKVRFAEMQRSVAKNLSASLGVVGGDNVGVVAGTGQFADHGNLVDTLGGATATSNAAHKVAKKLTGSSDSSESSNASSSAGE